MIVFWVALTAAGVLGFLFPYLGYPLLLRLAPRRHPPDETAPPDIWPSVSVIVTAFNAAGRLGEKVAELKALDYPGPLEIIVVDDGSTDDSVGEAERAGAHRVLRQPSNLGKSEAQNRGLEAATGEVAIFTDTGVRVAPDALRHLVAALLVEGVGCVTGVDHSLAAEATDQAQGAGFYTRFEIGLRRREAEAGTLLGVNGCLFAVRRAHRPPVPPECVDDLYVPLVVAAQDLRVTFHSQAVAHVPRARNFHEEYRRKVRTFTGGLFTLFRVRRDFPRLYRRLCLRLWGHKWLRWLGPFFAALALIGNIGLAEVWRPAWALLAVQITGWLTATAGAALTAADRRLPGALKIPVFFGVVQIALVHAWWRFFAGRPYITWLPTRRE